MTGILSAAALATALFGLIRYAFRFIVWYTRDDDPLFRKKLDRLWDGLQERTTFQITRSSLQQVALSLQVFTASRKGIVVASLVFLATNLIAIAIAASIWRCKIYYSPHESCSSLLAIWTYYFWGNPLSACFASMIGLLLFISLASLLASQQLVRIAASAEHTFSVIILLVGATAVIAVAAYVSWWAYVALNPFSIWQGESVPCVGDLSFFLSDTVREKFTLMSGRVDRYVKTFSTASDRFGIYWVGAWLGAVSSFPLVIALLMSGVLLTLRAMPRAANDFVVKCLFLISTDKEPVLSYVGTIAGVFAAVISFFISIHD